MKVIKNSLISLILILTSVQLYAQTALNKSSLDVNLIKNEYSGDYGNGIFNFRDNYFGGGVTYNRFISPLFNWGAETSFGNYGYKQSAANRFNGQKLDLILFGTFKYPKGYLISEKSKFSSFLSLGIGLAGYLEKPSLKAIGVDPFKNPMIIVGSDLIVPVTAGFTYQISPKVALKYKYSFNLTNSDRRDENRGPEHLVYHGDLDNTNDFFGKHSLGLSFQLGNNTDDDNDGIADKLDICFGTPEGAKVDEQGCPIDSDKDGVEDYKDKCNNTPAGAAVTENGCPVDTDYDGVVDYLDKCNDTPVGVAVDYMGCPIDTDKDGIADYLDKCNDTPVGSEIDSTGCVIDTDSDGVPDSKDLCPCTPENIAVTSNGCPVDSDCDGVADYLDKCPDEKGIAPTGCVGVMSEVINELSPNSRMEIMIKDKILEVEIVRVNTESGKVDKKKSAEETDDIASYLQQFKVVKVKTTDNNYKLSIDEINKKLTSKGSENARAYLLILKETKTKE
jgi:hypothetical protein